jgi:hypothetical protein
MDNPEHLVEKPLAGLEVVHWLPEVRHSKKRRREGPQEN